MGGTKDFVAATLSDAMLPLLRRPFEDVVYETLDNRHVPTRTEFKELRNLVNQLRTVASAHKQTAATLARIESRLDSLEGRLTKVETNQKATASDVSTPTGNATVVQDVVCAVEGCNIKPRAKGYCAPHYQKYRRGTL